MSSVGTQTYAKQQMRVVTGTWTQSSSPMPQCYAHTASTHTALQHKPINCSGPAIKCIFWSLCYVSWCVIYFAGTGLSDHNLLTGGYSNSPPDNGQRHYPAHNDDKKAAEVEVDRPLDLLHYSSHLQTWVRFCPYADG
jgi:hypothetical protein